MIKRNGPFRVRTMAKQKEHTIERKRKSFKILRKKGKKEINEKKGDKIEKVSAFFVVVVVG